MSSCRRVSTRSLEYFFPCTSNHGKTLTFFPVLFLLLSLPGLGSGQSGVPADTRNDAYNYTRLSPAMAVIVVVLIAALFFMGFFSIYIRHCTGSRADGSVNPITGARRSANGAARGLDASVIEAFPTFVYAEVKSLKIGKGALECAVCLNEFEDDETLRLLPKCDHVFHPHCIGAWLEGHVTCPVCRTNLAQENPGQPDEPTQPETDIEAQTEPELATVDTNPVDQPPEPRVMDGSGSLNGNRTRGSRSGRTRVKLPRSHSTGHSLVQPGEDTERFTLRLPAEVRKQIMANRELNRSNSLVVLQREGSSRRGKRVERLRVRSDRWLLLRTPSFLWRNSSIRSPKMVAKGDGEGTSVQPNGTIQLGGTKGSIGESARSDRWSFLRAPSFLWRNSSVRTPQESTSVHAGSTVRSNGDSVRLPV